MTPTPEPEPDLESYIKALDDLINENEPEEFRELRRSELVYHLQKWRSLAGDWAKEADHYRKEAEAARATHRRFLVRLHETGRLTLDELDRLESHARDT